MSRKKSKEKRRGAKPKKRLSSSHRQPRKIDHQVRIRKLTDTVRELEWENARLREAAQKMLGQAERMYQRKARFAAAWKALAARNKGLYAAALRDAERVIVSYARDCEAKGQEERVVGASLAAVRVRALRGKEGQ